MELKFLDVEKARFKKSTNLGFSNLDEDKENVLPEGCTIAGDPLHVSFLTIEKLEKLSKHNATSKYDHTNLIEYNPFEAHLLTSSEALELLNE